MNKAPFNIPNILGSLANDVASGQLTMEQASEELCRSHWTQFVDVKRTEHLLTPILQNTLRKDISMITHDNWPERWEDISPGTEISQEIYDQMFNALPPILLRKSPYSGFQMGEANDHREDENGRWRARFLTFVTSGGRFFYAGIHFGGECPMNFELHKENN